MIACLTSHLFCYRTLYTLHAQAFSRISAPWKYLASNPGQVSSIFSIRIMYGQCFLLRGSMHQTIRFKIIHRLSTN